MATVTYKCPNCDGGLVFSPEEQAFTCEYCGSLFTEEQLKAPSEAAEQKAFYDAEGSGDDAAAAGAASAAGAAGAASAAGATSAASDTSAAQFEQDAVLYSCPSCGAEIVTDSTTAATFCYYCHNPVVLQGRLSGNYKPRRIIPFAISRDEALDIFKKWVGNKKYLPSDFFNEKQIEMFTGVYFPYWLVDFDINGALDANATQVRTWTMGRRRYTETSRYRLEREGVLHFEDVTRGALTKANKLLADGVQPYDEKGLKPFNMAYLSGFQAEKRDVEVNALKDGVIREVRNYTQALLSGGEVKYTSVTPSELKVDIQKEDWEYTLMPVWTITYKDHKGNMYYYSINGQTGKTCGKLPVDKKKLARLFTLVAVPILAVMMILGWLF